MRVMNMQSLILAPLFALFLSSGTVGQINVPEKTDIYQPIVATSSEDAALYIWFYDDGVNAIEVDNGKTAHLWARPGSYKIYLTTVSVDFDKKQVTYSKHASVFTVVGEGPDPQPLPIPPDVDPDPQPEPQPEPEPEPEPEPVDPFIDAIQTSLKLVPTEFTSDNKAVARNYSAVADSAKDKPESWDPASMLNEVKSRNISDLSLDALRGYSPLWSGISKAFIALKLDKEDLDGHIKAFEKISEVLNGGTSR